MKHCETYSVKYDHYYRYRKSKADWKGLSLGDAFKHNLDHYERLPALRLFYKTVNKVTKTIAKQTGASSETEFIPKVKPQLGPCYTFYPSNISAYAAIGLTAYLEYKARISENSLSYMLSGYLEDPAKYHSLNIDKNVFKQIAKIVTDCVESRLLIEDMSRLQYASSVEVYRLFLASQETMRFQSVPEIIRAIVLFGDILPAWQDQELHPMTMAMLLNVMDASEPFLEILCHTKSSEFSELGAEWVKKICEEIAVFLPEDKKDERQSNESEQPNLNPDTSIVQFRYQKDVNKNSLRDSIPPLNGRNPPFLFNVPNFAKQAAQIIEIQMQSNNVQSPENNETPQKNPIQEMLKEFANTIENITQQSSNWEDMPSDHVESAMRISGFRQSPIEGNPSDGHSITVDFGNDQIASGEIFDRPIELSDDIPAFENLKAEARPITDALKRSLYPNIVESPQVERFKTSGVIDPLRLHLADLSPAIYRRHNIYEKADPKGKPILLIACDGSGSLGKDQMNMLKTLTTAWISATKKSGTQVMAGLYHSGTIRRGISGALVQWLYHPLKTPSFSQEDAIRGLVSLPESGTGAQSDALSLNFMLNETKRLARGQMVYLVVISDCCWNRSFYINKTASEEVHGIFENAYKDFNGKLNITLIALGVSANTGFENLLDKVTVVSSEELKDSVAVANNISVYVASCMRERKKWLSKKE